MSVEQGIETITIPATTDNTPMRAHIVCGTCYDTDPTPMGTPAICGEKVLGKRARAATCEVCQRVKSAHGLMHFGGR